MGRLLISLALGGGLFVLVASQLGLFNKTAETGGVPNQVAKVDPQKQAELQLGDWLYGPRPATPIKVGEPVLGARNDAVVFTGHMNVLDKIDVSTILPGQLLFVGEEVPEGVAQVAGIAPFMHEPFQYAPVDQAGRELMIFYKRLYEDEMVQGNQVVAKVNPAKALGELAIKRARVSAAQAESRGANAAFKEAEARHERAKKLRAQGVISEEDYGAALLTMIKFYEESITKLEAIRLGKIEEDQAEIQLRLHDIRNKIPTRNAFIKTIFRQRGEAVREQEPVMQMYSLDRLKAEALVEVQYLPRIRPGVRVTIEPTQEEAPRVLKAHRGEITGVAVMGRNPAEPLIVTASDDRFVCLWNRFGLSPLEELAHPEPIRSLAVSPSGAEKQWVLAGLNNGNVHAWEVVQKGNQVEVDKNPKILDKVQRDAITSLAFSPELADALDGKKTPAGAYFAVGGADGSISLYRTADFQLIYRFDAEHGATTSHAGAVTSLHFTPQCQLISASRDNTVRLWQLKENGVALASAPITGRSGNVPQLGVSMDGRYMLFDRARDLQLLSAQDGRKLNTLQNPAGGVPFETVAVFSPDASLLLTAGASEGRLQLWRAPTENTRGFEVRSFVPSEKERFPVTCATFAPLAGKTGAGDASFAVSGTKEGYVYLWPVPSPEEVEQHRIKDVPVQLIGQSLDASTRQVRISVMIPNLPTPRHPNGRFIPGRPVTMVVE